MRNNRILAIIITMFLLLTLIFSFLFIVENVHHTCTGEDCPICMEIEAAINTISGFKALPVILFSMAVICVFTQICTEDNLSNCGKNTLITLKVKLQD